MAHIKEDTDDAVDEGWLPAANDPYLPASPQPTEVDDTSSPEVGRHMVDAKLSLENPKEEEEEIPKTEEGEEVDRYMAALKDELGPARVDEPKVPKTEEEKEVGSLLAAMKDELDQARIDEPKIPLPAASRVLKKKEEREEEELGLARVDEPVIPKEEKKEELGPMEEPIDPHAAAPARSMHQAPAARGSVDAKKEVGAPHCSANGVDPGIHASRPARSSSSSYKVVAPSSSAHGVDQRVDASQPTGSKSSSYKVDAPSSSAHGVDQGIDASRPAGSKSSSHEVDTPSFSAREATKIDKIDAELFDKFTPAEKRAAAILDLAPNQSWRTKGGAGWRSKRGGSGPGSQKWKNDRFNERTDAGWNR